MNKIVKKVVPLLVAAVTGVSLCACGLGKGGDGGTEGNGTLLRIYNYNGGYGTEWLYNAAEAYKAEHEGVTINIFPEKKSELSITEIKNSVYSLYFLEGFNYAELMGENALDDISEALTTENPYDNGKKIVDKLTAQQKEYYQIDGKYYALPHYAGNNGLIYNKKIFDQYKLYFKKDRPAEVTMNFDQFFVNSLTEARSEGPNGKTGTENGVDYSLDDGLPATYDEFILLLTYMTSIFGGNSIKPFTFTGQSSEQYITYLYNALVADYEGPEQMLLNYDFDGVATDLGRIVDGQFVKDSEPTTISEGAMNGYELARQAGKYYALKFLNDIFRNTSFYDAQAAISTATDTNMAAQLRFVRGQAAILTEGVWWEAESEAGNNFSNANTTKDDCEFGWMPFPKADKSKLGGDTIVDNLYSMCFLKPGLNEADKALAIDFIQFLYSDPQLVQYTKDTGTMRALNYSLSASDLESLTYYGRSLYNYTKASTTIFPFSKSSLFINHKRDLEGRYYYTSDHGPGGQPYSTPTKMILNDWISNSREANVAAYFTGMYTNHKTKWEGWS